MELLSHSPMGQHAWTPPGADDAASLSTDHTIKGKEGGHKHSLKHDDVMMCCAAFKLPLVELSPPHPPSPLPNWKHSFI